ncbi:MAG: family 16 glycosylhydrolase [Cyclobacteriaceae bacterium]|nr:family 16 glycosylhydrolase [Cyclobacteriaceae bacterium]
MKRIALVSIFALILGFSCDDKETVVTGIIMDQYSVTEGNGTASKSFTVSIVGEINSTVQVRYELQPNSAKEGTDFIINEGTLEFSPGNTHKSVSFDIVGDNHKEITEEFTIIFEFSGTQYIAPIQIMDDDPIEPILIAEDGYYTPGEYPSMKLAWGDEFDGAALNSASWTHEIGNGCSVGICGWGNNELQVYTDKTENLIVDNGKLVITARQEAGGGYTSARIKTENKRELKFGRIDVRAKLPKGQGLWPAIWMLGENIDIVGWPSCGEIDIMELRGGSPATVDGTVHYNSDGYKYNSSSTTLSSGDFSEKFHVFSIVWDFNTITWYVDNKEFKKFNNSNIASWPFNKPFFFIMNVAVGGNYGGPPNGTTVFPQQMTVDYIRVFQ